MAFAPLLILDDLRRDAAKQRARLISQNEFFFCEACQKDDCLCVKSRKFRRIKELYPDMYIDMSNVEEETQFVPAKRSIMNKRRIVERNPCASECSICYDTIIVGKYCTKVVACAHSFHVHCAKRWFDVQSTCPLCRHCVTT